MKKVAAYLFVFAFSILLFSPRESLADSSQGLTVTPASQEVVIDGNQEKADFSINLSNNTGYAATFSLLAIDFGTLDELGGISFENGSDSKYGLASWISLEKDSVTLSAGEKQTIRASIKNKDTLSPGGHYAAILFKMERSGDEKNNNSSQVALNPSLVSLIFAKKIGGERYGLTLVSQEAKTAIFSLFSAVRLRFQNTGNTQVVPRGAVDIFDPLGRNVKRGIINPESLMILPETFRVIPVSLKGTSFAFLPGRYKMVIQYRYDGKDEFVRMEQNFYYIPINVLVLVLGGLIGGIVLKARLKNKDK